jgi:Rrf2 family protein
VKISTKGEYGLRAMLYLAMNEDRGRPVPSYEIAKHQDIPEAYLRQILSVLSRKRLIAAVRGPQGGHRLGRPAAAIPLREILIVLEGHTTSVDRILELPCDVDWGPENCAIRGVYLEVKQAVERILNGTSLADLAQRQRSMAATCPGAPDPNCASSGLLRQAAR